MLCSRDTSTKPQYTATGQGIALLSNRISWFYDLKGPSSTLDTGCSSSLVALHQACESIRSPTNGTRTALVGGCGLILSPDLFTSLSALHFLSPDSRSFSFDERANGYGRGEGIAMLVLKQIDDAIRDGDTIRAVIRGTGVNQDGRTSGITLPSCEAQANLIRNTYGCFGLSLSDTMYFEARKFPRALLRLTLHFQHPSPHGVEEWQWYADKLSRRHRDSSW
jgi:acyl transferase domain-containing protein